MSQRQQGRLQLLGRWLLTVAIIGFVIWSVDASSLWQELARFSPAILVPALGLTVFQVALSAWRWRYTAARLGLCLPYAIAVREYYLAMFLNQVLPGGVLGDVNRAWRHGTGAGERLSAAHGVAIERLSGQLVLALVVVLCVSWLLGSGRVTAVEWQNGFWTGVGLVVLSLGIWLVLKARLAAYLQLLRRDLYQALLNRRALPVQTGSSLLVLASYLAVFLCLGWGAGYFDDTESMLIIASLGSVLLLSMAIPLTVAGWGIREGAAAVLWPMAGLPAEQGVALSIGYGALVLVSSLPGLLVLLAGQPGRA